jgi:aldehyde:ferredoxin oxidoreductase
MVAWHDDMFAVADSLGICKFVTHGFNSPNLLGYSHFAESIEAAMGLPLSVEDLRLAGQAVIDMERWLNLQFGRTRADDTLPKRYFDEPMPARATKGHRIERDQFERMLDQYYAARQWDSEGVPSAERLEQLEAWISLAEISD